MKIVKSILIMFLLLGTTTVMMSGCASKSYDKGFDEAD